MNKLFPLLVSSVLLIGAVGCQDTTKTSAEAPNTTNETAQAPDAQTAQQTKNDATSETHRK